MISRWSLNFLRVCSIVVALILNCVIYMFYSWMAGSEMEPRKLKYFWIRLRCCSGEIRAKYDSSRLIFED